VLVKNIMSANSEKCRRCNAAASIAAVRVECVLRRQRAAASTCYYVRVYVHETPRRTPLICRNNLLAVISSCSLHRLRKTARLHHSNERAKRARASNCRLTHCTLSSVFGCSLPCFFSKMSAARCMCLPRARASTSCARCMQMQTTSCARCMQMQTRQLRHARARATAAHLHAILGRPILW